MRKLLALCGTVLCFAAVAAAQDNVVAPATSSPASALALSALPSAPSATAASSRGSGMPRSRSYQEYSWQLGISYAYVRVRPNTGTTFGMNGLSTHLTYFFSNSIGLKAAVEPLFGTTPSSGTSFNGVPSLTIRTVFFGGGPVFAYRTSSKIEPWVHVMVGGVHLRLTQTAAGPGTANAFAIQGGGGVDIKFAPRFYWRVEGDYFGTRFFSTFQHNIAVKSGPVFNF